MGENGKEKQINDAGPLSPMKVWPMIIRNQL